MQPVSVPGATTPAPQLNVQQAVQQLVNGSAPINTSAPAKPPVAPTTKDKPDNNHAVSGAPVETPEAAAQTMLPSVKPITPSVLATVGAQLSLMLADTGELRVGGKQRVAVMLEADAPLNSALVALTFDPAKLKVTSLMPGDSSAGARLLQQLDPSGKVSVMVMPANNTTLKASASILFYLDVEAIGAGANALDFDRSGIRLSAADNRDAFARFPETGLTVKQ